MKKKAMIFRGRLLGDLKGFEDNTVFTLEDGSWWLQVDGFSRQAEASAPEAELWQDGSGYFLRILDSQIRVRPLANAFRDRIEGDFNGWEDCRQYKLACGRTFRQACFGFEYAYAESPEAVVADLDGVTMMFVCGTAMEVKECGLTGDHPHPADGPGSKSMTRPESPESTKNWLRPAERDGTRKERYLKESENSVSRLQPAESNCPNDVSATRTESTDAPAAGLRPVRTDEFGFPLEPVQENPAGQAVDTSAVSPVSDWLIAGRDLSAKEDAAAVPAVKRKRFRSPARYEKLGGDLAPDLKSEKTASGEDVQDPDATNHNRRGAGVLSIMLVLLLILAVGVPVAVFGGVGAYKYAKDADQITLGLSQEAVYDMKYTEVEEALRKAGFSNIETNNIPDLDISQADRENKVGSMVVNNSEEYSEDSRFPSYVAIVINYHTLRQISPSMSAKDAKGGNYEEIARQLESDGFVNIRYEVIEDLVTGWLVKDGQVEEVIINDEKDFKADSAYRQDVDVVIRYHTFGNFF